MNRRFKQRFGYFVAGDKVTRSAERNLSTVRARARNNPPAITLGIKKGRVSFDTRPFRIRCLRDHRRPVVLAVDVGEAIGGVGLALVDIDVADLRVGVVEPGLVDEAIAVLIGAVVVVVVAQEHDLVARGQLGDALGDGLGLAVEILAAGAGNVEGLHGRRSAARARGP